jgi:hypothetical protein
MCIHFKLFAFFKGNLSYWAESKCLVDRQTWVKLSAPDATLIYHMIALPFLEDYKKYIDNILIQCIWHFQEKALQWKNKYNNLKFIYKIFTKENCPIDICTTCTCTIILNIPHYIKQTWSFGNNKYII